MTVESLERELESSKKHLETIISQRDEVDKSNATQAQDLRERDERIRRFVEEQAGLKAELAAQAQAMERATSKIEELQKLKTEHSDQIRQFTVQAAVSELKMEKLQSDVTMLEDRSKSAAKDLAGKEELLKQSMSELLDTQKKYAIVDCEKRELQSQVTRYKVATEEQERNMQRFVQERMELTLQMGIKEQELKQIKEQGADELARMQKKEADLKAQIEKLTAMQNSALEEAVAANQEQADKLKKAAEGREAELQARVDELLAQLTSSQEQGQANVAAGKDVQGQIESLEQEAKDLRQANSDLEASVAKLKAEHAEVQEACLRLTEQRDEHQATATTLHDELKTMQERVIAAEKQATEAREALNAKVAECETLAEEKTKLEAAMADQKATLADDAAEIAKLQKLATNRQGTIEEQSGQIEDLLEDIKDLEARNTQLKNHVQKAMDKIEDLREQRAEHMDRADSLREANAQLCEEFNARTCKSVFEAPEWRNFIQEMHQNFQKHMPQPETEEAGGLLGGFFSSRRQSGRPAHRNSFRQNGPAGRDSSFCGSQSDFGGSFSRNALGDSSLSSIQTGQGIQPTAELLEEMAALRVRNKVLENTLSKMQKVMADQC